MRLIYSKK